MKKKILVFKTEWLTVNLVISYFKDSRLTKYLLNFKYSNCWKYKTFHFIFSCSLSTMVPNAWNYLFQVITGGNYDVDVTLYDPKDKVLYTVQKKQYDSHSVNAEQDGTYKFCFSNEFSTFTHKTVYFDFQAGDEVPLTKTIGEHHTALTQMETACVTIHENLKVIIRQVCWGRSRALLLRTNFVMTTFECFHWQNIKKRTSNSYISWERTGPPFFFLYKCLSTYFQHYGKI
jgi:hypothetical protein